MVFRLEDNRSTVLINDIRYKSGVRIAGIVYLYDVSQDTPVSSRKPLAVFRQFCDPSMLDNVILTTTKWSKLCGRLPLDATGNLIGSGVQSSEFRDTRESAHKIIRSLMNKAPVRPNFRKVNKPPKPNAKQGFWANFWRTLFG